jgi:hypothetical protein
VASVAGFWCNLAFLSLSSESGRDDAYLNFSRVEGDGLRRWSLHIFLVCSLGMFPYVAHGSLLVLNPLDEAELNNAI